MFSSLKSDGSEANRPPVALVVPEPQESLIEALEAAGYSVCHYTHPLKALESIAEQSIKQAIVATDLPWMSGDAVVRTLRESYRLTNVLLLDKALDPKTIISRLRSGTPTEEPAAKVKERRPASTARTTKSGRRILIRPARPR